MRVVFVGLAVALMATTAMAAGTGHVTLTVGGSATYAPAEGETFRVDVNITADRPMDAWGMEPVDSNDVGYQISASVIGGVYSNIAMNYVDAGPPFSNTAGWDVFIASAKAWPAGDLNDLQVTSQVRPGTLGTPTAVGGWACYIELTAPSGKADVITNIELVDVYAGDENHEAFDVMTYDPLVLTPEPTSALLLLGALPLLRRRR
jgi:hypothetical protein